MVDAVALNFHPLLVHLPIGMLLLAALATLRDADLQPASPQPALLLIWRITTFTAVLACASGWLTGRAGGYAETLYLRHQWLGFATAAVSVLVTWLLPQIKRRRHKRLLVGLPVLLLLGATHFGAMLTHGAQYWLPQHASTEVLTDQTPTVVPAFDVPAGQAPPPDPAAMETLRRRGLVVLPLAQGSPWLSVNAVNVPGFSDAEARLLERLAPQIVWLKLGGTAITDSALVSIGKLNQLSRLQLDHTHINGSGLRYLRDLKHLRLLNLSGTATTTEALTILSELPALQTVFLFQTPAAKAAAQLQPHFPQIRLDTGGYLLPMLPGDTARLKAKYQ